MNDNFDAVILGFKEIPTLDNVLLIQKTRSRKINLKQGYDYINSCQQTTNKTMQL